MKGFFLTPLDERIYNKVTDTKRKLRRIERESEEEINFNRKFHNFIRKQNGISCENEKDVGRYIVI